MKQFFGKHWKKFVGGLVALLLATAGLGFWGMKQLGKVTVPKFEQISENIYATTEGINQASMYLVLGETDAYLIDTANGLSEIPAGIEQVTDLPVTVINTHGHYDHTRGNHFFETVYVPAKDKQVYENYNKPETVDKVMRSELPDIMLFLMSDYTKTVHSTPIKEDVTYFDADKTFDLGGRTFSIVELPGHTPGSVGIIDSQTKTAFIGDALTNVGYLLGLAESLSLEIQKETLLTLKNLFESGQISVAYGGHTNQEITLETVDKGLVIVDKIISGDLTETEKATGHITYEGMSVSFKTK